MSDNIFTKHPHEGGETYFGHLWFTIKIFVYLVITALATLTHGLFPFLCTTTGSTRVLKLRNLFISRLNMRDERTKIQHPH